MIEICRHCKFQPINHDMLSCDWLKFGATRFSALPKWFKDSAKIYLMFLSWRISKHVYKTLGTSIIYSLNFVTWSMEYKMMLYSCKLNPILFPFKFILSAKKEKSALNIVLYSSICRDKRMNKSAISLKPGVNKDYNIHKSEALKR